MELENFEAVWQRVTAAEDFPPPEANITTPSAPAKAICMIKRGEKSRATRFLAGMRE